MAAVSGIGRPGVFPAAGPRVHLSDPSSHDPATLPSRRRACLLLLAVLVAVFVTLYPSPGVAHDSCGTGGCPQASHVGTMGTTGTMDSACLGAICAAAVPPAPYTPSVLGVFSKRRILPEPRPDEAYRPPNTRPPRPSPGR